MSEEDPVIGRLDDALTRVDRIEARASSGETIPNQISSLKCERSARTCSPNVETLSNIVKS